MNTELLISDIEHLEVLNNVEPEQALSILKNCPVIELTDEQILLTKGSSNQNLYFILSGKLAVYLEYPGFEPLALLEKGGTVGELSVIDDSPVSAFVVAEGNTKVLEINEIVFWHLTTESHAFACNMLLLLSSRMRVSDDLLLKNIHLRKRFEKDAMVDALTGLHNRRWLDLQLPRLINRHQRDGTPLSIIMFDVDHFKVFNDKYGHDAGDEVLLQVAKTTRLSLRPADLYGRLGGEEFIIMLAGIKKEFAWIVAERLRKAVSSKKTITAEIKELPPVTISLGISELRPGDTAETLLKRADNAMYDAKENGRNRTCQETKA